MLKTVPEPRRKVLRASDVANSFSRFLEGLCRSPMPDGIEVDRYRMADLLHFLTLLTRSEYTAGNPDADTVREYRSLLVSILEYLTREEYQEIRQMNGMQLLNHIRDLPLEDKRRGGRDTFDSFLFSRMASSSLLLDMIGAVDEADALLEEIGKAV